MNAETHNAARLALLAAMGIDVWVRRRARVAPVRQVAPPREAPGEGAIELSGASARSVTQSRGREVSPEADAPEPIVWTSIGVGSVVLLGRIDGPSERRLALDIAMAAAGYPSESPSIVTFVQTRVSGAAAAPEVVAFVRGQTDRRRATDQTTKARLLIVTQSTARELGLDTTATPVEPFHGVECVVVPEMAAMRASPETKQDVWRALNRKR